MKLEQSLRGFPKVAVIGLGAMGLPMARRLAGDFSVVAFDTNHERLALAKEGGVGSASTPAEAAASADVVVLAVRDYEQVRAALFDSNGVTSTMRGGVVIVTSTIGPDAIRAVSSRLEKMSLHLVDAPVSGGPVRAERGDLLVLVGAASEALDLAGPVLERLASTITVVGERAGDGQVIKAINQLLAGVHIAAAAEAIALARALGVDPNLVIESLSRGAASSFMFSDRGPRMVEAYSGGAEVKSRLDIFVKDMGIVTEVAKHAHVPTPLAAAAQQLYLLAEKAGFGADDDSSVVRILSPITEA
ncbi:MAG: NAD(P)-dependent oxidoreductase [Lacisediminihabitans sp.]